MPRTGPPIVSGCASNQGRCDDLLEHEVLRTAPLEVLLARVAARPPGAYGTRAADRVEIAQYQEVVVPLLRRRATAEWDTATASIAELDDRVVALAAA